MDKQTIIDGVDVSGCEYYDKNKSLLTCTCEEYACSECHNCYYKQLKRKEQECEELRKEQTEIKKYLGISHKTILERLEELTEFRDEDRDEIFQLKEQLDQAIAQREAFWAMYRTKHGDLADKYEKLKAENEDLKKSILQVCPNCGEEYLNYKGVELYYENNDLKQTIADIKKFVENEMTQNGDTYIILQKISECEGNNDLENN